MELTIENSSGLITLLEEIGYDIRESAITGTYQAADLIPGFIRETFDVQGARGGNPLWKRLTPHSITWRQTYPTGTDYNTRQSYFESHQPLIDTGALRESFELNSVQEGDTMITASVTSTLDYGFGQDSGTGMTPDNQPVWARPFMFIVEGEDTDRIDAAFEGAWSE